MTEAVIIGNIAFILEKNGYVTRLDNNAYWVGDPDMLHEFAEFFFKAEALRRKDMDLNKK